MPPPTNSRGNAYNALNQHQEALEDYDKAIELDPEELDPNGLAKAHYNRGVVLERLGRNDEAKDAFTKAQKIDPRIFTKKVAEPIEKELKKDLKEEIKPIKEGLEKAQELQKIFEDRKSF